MADDETHVNWNTVKKFPTYASALREIERLQNSQPTASNSRQLKYAKHNVGNFKMRLYGIKIHDRLKPEDPDLGTVMYNPSGNPEGPWSDIATCDRDWAWEILDALQAQAATEDDVELSSESLKD